MFLSDVRVWIAVEMSSDKLSKKPFFARDERHFSPVDMNLEPNICIHLNFAFGERMYSVRNAFHHLLVVVGAELAEFVKKVKGKNTMEVK